MMPDLSSQDLCLSFSFFLFTTKTRGKKISCEEMDCKSSASKESNGVDLHLSSFSLFWSRWSDVAFLSPPSTSSPLKCLSRSHHVFVALLFCVHLISSVVVSPLVPLDASSFHLMSLDPSWVPVNKGCIPSLFLTTSLHYVPFVWNQEDTHREKERQIKRVQERKNTISWNDIEMEWKRETSVL